MKRVMVLLVMALAAVACSSGANVAVNEVSEEEVESLADTLPGRVEGFEEGVRIPDSDFTISDSACRERLGTAEVDGETVPDRQWVLSGLITSTLDVDSPRYEVAVEVGLSDGTGFQAGGQTIDVIPAGGTGQFLVFVGGQSSFDDTTATVISCEPIVLDSILNYVQE